MVVKCSTLPSRCIELINEDVVGDKCVRNDAGELSLSDEQKMKAWVKYHSKLFEWPSDNLPDVAPTLGSIPPVTSSLIQRP